MEVPANGNKFSDLLKQPDLQLEQLLGLIKRLYRRILTPVRHILAALLSTSIKNYPHWGKPICYFRRNILRNINPTFSIPLL
jgi:hypothetical protein